MTNEMTKEQRAELRELCNAATPGPWGVDKRDGIARSEWENGEHDNDCLAFDIVTEADKSGESAFLELQGFHKGMIQRSADALFIAASRAVVPALLDALDAADARIAVLESAVRAALDWTDNFKNGIDGDVYQQLERALGVAPPFAQADTEQDVVETKGGA